MCYRCERAHRSLKDCDDKKGKEKDRSRSSSANSTTSVESNASVSSIESNKSIGTMTNNIEHELHTAKYSSNRLEAYANSIHPGVYLKTPSSWPSSVEKEYKKYKKLGEDLGTAHTKYKNLRRSLGKVKDYTADEHVDCAKLAVEWGKATIKAAKARVDFFESYRQAYKLDAVKTHIGEIRGQIASGESAVEEARTHRDNAIRAFTRAANPAVFQD